MVIRQVFGVEVTTSMKRAVLGSAASALAALVVTSIKNQPIIQQLGIEG